ncbi:MAG: MaoC family dehydratase [Anaerolineae bacterium]
MIEVGMQASRTRQITEHEVRLFAEASGDHNPLHMDEAYAASTAFGRRIVHGMLVAGLISAVLANDLPGPGAVYVSQTLRFKAPVFLGDTVTAMVEVLKVRRRMVTLQTTCTNQEGLVVLEGEAVVMLPAQHEL